MQVPELDKKNTENREPTFKKEEKDFQGKLVLTTMNFNTHTHTHTHMHMHIHTTIIQSDHREKMYRLMLFLYEMIQLST